jgi:hypothetical protein
MLHTLLRLPAVKAQSGYSRSTIYLRMSQGLWTHPVSLGARAGGLAGGRRGALNAARIAGKTDDADPQAGERLEAARGQAGAGFGNARGVDGACKQRPNPRLAKIHRSYTVDEIATLYGVHRNTVRAWIKRGLPTVDDQRGRCWCWATPGATSCRRGAMVNKRPCGPGQIYCLRCREPRAPAGGAVRYQPLTPTQGNLVGLCGCCGAGLYRRVSRAKLAAIQGTLRVTLRAGAGAHRREP